MAATPNSCSWDAEQQLRFEESKIMEETVGEDPMLDAMLRKAELLANQMKLSSSSRSSNSQLPSVPDTIDMKDTATECSSLGFMTMPAKGKPEATTASAAIKTAPETPSGVNDSFDLRVESILQEFSLKAVKTPKMDEHVMEEYSLKDIKTPQVDECVEDLTLAQEKYQASETEVDVDSSKTESLPQVAATLVQKLAKTPKATQYVSLEELQNSQASMADSSNLDGSQNIEWNDHFVKTEEVSTVTTPPLLQEEDLPSPAATANEKPLEKPNTTAAKNQVQLPTVATESKRVKGVLLGDPPLSLGHKPALSSDSERPSDDLPRKFENAEEIVPSRTEIFRSKESSESSLKQLTPVQSSEETLVDSKATRNGPETSVSEAVMTALAMQWELQATLGTSSTFSEPSPVAVAPKEDSVLHQSYEKSKMSTASVLKSPMPELNNADVVPVADYSSSKLNDITWEKVSMVCEEDDDYVQLRDYSNVARPYPIVPEPVANFYSERLRKRQSRRSRRRRLILLAVVGFIAACAWFWRKTSTVAVPPASKSIPIKDEKEAVVTLSAEQLSQASSTADAAVNTEDSPEVKPDEICQLSLASVLSPVCSRGYTIVDKSARQRLIQEILDQMLL